MNNKKLMLIAAPVAAVAALAIAFKDTSSDKNPVNHQEIAQKCLAKIKETSLKNVIIPEGNSPVLHTNDAAIKAASEDFTNCIDKNTPRTAGLTFSLTFRQ